MKGKNGYYIPDDGLKWKSMPIENWTIFVSKFAILRVIPGRCKLSKRSRGMLSSIYTCLPRGSWSDWKIFIPSYKDIFSSQLDILKRVRAYSIHLSLQSSADQRSWPPSITRLRGHLELGALTWWIRWSEGLELVLKDTRKVCDPGIALET